MRHTKGADCLRPGGRPVPVASLESARYIVKQCQELVQIKEGVEEKTAEPILV